jgi:hypothetical protein
MQHIEALTEYEPGPLPAVFLAGGITGRPDWRQQIVTQLLPFSTTRSSTKIDRDRGVCAREKLIGGVPTV